ncbi:tubulin binding cofactor C-domain-containing protein [Elsinoe ampelina]|uniref:Tubulin binding cofactor C-domain-containing protein n=1 Tax=Elsinoe ampelina TaxID=302913 RepID=A0A6A6G3J4_9PEZI|nr:tubulin binding cofactor C-domain-containing protein [Elsinoe ampelina]
MGTDNTPEDVWFSKADVLQRSLQSMQDDYTAGQKRIPDLQNDFNALSGDYAALIRSRDQFVATLPPHGQKRIKEKVETLTSKHDFLKSKIKPRQKFSFQKSATSNASAASTPPPPQSDHGPPESTAEPENSGPTTTVSSERVAGPIDISQPTPEPAFPASHAPMIRRASFSNGPVRIANHSDVHLSLSPNAQVDGKTGTLLSLERSVVNLAPGSSPQKALSSLSAKDISDSLLILGHIDGAVHITGLNTCRVAVSCRQFRMHESKDVDVYLSCSSEPIIEDCQTIRFGELPGVLDSKQSAHQQWQDVKDFDWVGAGASPNWRILDPGERIDDQTWEKVRNDELDREEALHALGLSVTR